MKEDGKKHVLFFSIIFLIVLLDQLTKYLIRIYDSIKITDFFSLTFIKNTGISFGLLQGNNLIFIFITLLIISSIFYYYNRIIENKFYFYSFALIIGGALGNLIDRIFLGFVVDFIDFSFWYSFNVADSAICVGGIILLYYSFRR